VKGDPTEIHQIVMNLCNNACQAMKGQSGVLEVTLDDFEVDDTCPGGRKRFINSSCI
jgi:two-component system cell cycle sensor histidine kinase/response regulator CckA